MNVPTMWISAQAADTQMSWEQVGAWSRTHDLLLHHELRLRALQRELSAAWPPERSPAAAAFVEHVGGLLARVAQAREDAARNSDALKLLLESLASAKRDMAPLKKAWDQFEAQQSSTPRPYKGQTWQEILNAKAQARMERNDREVFEAMQLMVVSDRGRVATDDSEDLGDSRLTELVHSRQVASGSYLGPSAALPTNSSAFSGQSGPQLAGGQNMNPVSSVPSPPLIPSSSGSEIPPSRVPPASAMVSVPPRLGFSQQAAGSSLARPNGGVVGYRPPSASSASFPHSPYGGSVQRSGTRVNPIGGVISSTSPGMAGMPLARSGGNVKGDEGTRQSVPTVQWDVARGGVPVIEPSTEIPFELGPGVIGIDR